MVWECACGEGHISKVLESHGYDVVSTDLVYRGYGRLNPCDFLLENVVDFSGDIITNPPYKYALEFVEHALNTVQQGRKVAMFLKLTFLEGKARKAFFLKNPPKVVYVSSSRLECGKNGKFESKNAVAYAWFVWEKGFCGAQLEYIKQWRERKRKKKDRRKDYWMETVWHLRMFFDMLFKFVKG